MYIPVLCRCTKSN